MATALDLRPGTLIFVPTEGHYDYDEKRWLRPDECPAFPARVTGVEQTATGHQIAVAYLEDGEPYTFDLTAGRQVQLVHIG